MDTIENLIIAIVKPLIASPDQLTIKIIDGPEFLEYHLDLAPADIGRVIGKKGRTITAIRAIVYSVPTQGKKVRLVIDEKEVTLGLPFLHILVIPRSLWYNKSVKALSSRKN